MTLAAGTRFGVYEILTAIGAGGMGEVFQARDTRLDRDVAIKILPEAFAADVDRVARFEREARTLAALNHPNVAQIYGLEHANGVHALVMELVVGKDLSAHIARGPIPLDEALPIARQIADALEVAHEQGIVHRDLKPANIKIRPDGTVKVLDFGLAKMQDTAAASARMADAATITTPAMTQAGMILGTAAYMSPEQAKGRAADSRSDIWAFGCVLFEMLTARRAFDGENVADTLAGVLRGDPPWAELPDKTPPAVMRLLRRCLQKDSRQRLQHIGDARLELDEPAARLDPAVVRTRTPGRRWVWAAAGITALGVGAVARGVLTPAQPTAPVRRFSMPVPRSTSLSSAVRSDLAISPDGRTLVYALSSVGLLKRSADAWAFQPIRGAEGGVAPFFSPDGVWIGFRADGKLKKVPVGGGLVINICDAPDFLRSTWGDDGSIVMATSAGDLFRVAANGGDPALLLRADRDGIFAEPRLLPGSHALLVRRGPAIRGRIEALDLKTLAHHSLADGTSPQLASTGDLVFEQRGGIWAVNFDAKRLAASGTPVLVVDSVLTSGGNAQFSTAADGSLVYLAGQVEQSRPLVWIDRAGKTTAALEGGRGRWLAPRLSPDGKWVAVSVADGSDLDVWAYEFERGTGIRLTAGGSNRRSVWSPDGSRVAFYSSTVEVGSRNDRGGVDQDLYVVPSTGGQPARLLVRPGAQFPDTWSPDGRVLLFEEGEGSAGLDASKRDLWMLPIGGVPQPLLVTAFYERGAVFSRDGHWLAFVTDESGRDEVYVQPFPGPGPKITISNHGGLQPMWSRDGRELFYREGDWMMAVSIALNPFRVGAPTKLFEFPAARYNLDRNFADYDIASDGRFLASRGAETTGDEIRVVLNWAEDLRRALRR